MDVPSHSRMAPARKSGRPAGPPSGRRSGVRVGEPGLSPHSACWPPERRRPVERQAAREIMSRAAGRDLDGDLPESPVRGPSSRRNHRAVVHYQQDGRPASWSNSVYEFLVGYEVAPHVVDRLSANLIARTKTPIRASNIAVV